MAERRRFYEKRASRSPHGDTPQLCALKRSATARATVTPRISRDSSTAVHNDRRSNLSRHGLRRRHAAGQMVPGSPGVDFSDTRAWACSARSPPPWPMHTIIRSCIATSSRTTSWSIAMDARICSTSASPVGFDEERRPTPCCSLFDARIRLTRAGPRRDRQRAHRLLQPRRIALFPHRAGKPPLIFTTSRSRQREDDRRRSAGATEYGRCDPRPARANWHTTIWFIALKAWRSHRRSLRQRRSAVQDLDNAFARPIEARKLDWQPVPRPAFRPAQRIGARRFSAIEASSGP